MPMYNLICKCGNKQEEMLSIAQYEKGFTCEKCGEIMRNDFSSYNDIPFFVAFGKLGNASNSYESPMQSNMKKKGKK